MVGMDGKEVVCTNNYLCRKGSRSWSVEERLGT